jgi:hypothetical protein
MRRMPLTAKFELDAGTRTFATGLLPELIATLRRADPGDLIAVVSSEAGLGARRSRPGHTRSR